MDLELIHFQILGALLFSIGLYGVLARRSAVLVLISIELLLNAVNIIYERDTAITHEITEIRVHTT